MIRTFKIDDSTEKGKIFIRFLTTFGLIESENTDHYILKDIEKSFEQIKLMRAGELPKQNLDEL